MFKPKATAVVGEDSFYVTDISDKHQAEEATTKGLKMVAVSAKNKYVLWSQRELSGDKADKKKLLSTLTSDFLVKFGPFQMQNVDRARKDLGIAEN